jgi:hypothetical protein
LQEVEASTDRRWIGANSSDAVLDDLGGFLDATGWKLTCGFDLGKGSESDAMV